MSSSMIATIYLIALVVFFLILSVLTIVWIASKSGKNDVNDDEEYDDVENIFSGAEGLNGFTDLSDDTGEDTGDSAFIDDSAFYDTGITDETYVNTFDDKAPDDKEKTESGPEKAADDILLSEKREAAGDSPVVDEAADIKETVEQDEAADIKETVEQDTAADISGTIKDEETGNAFEEGYIDSAFAPEPVETGLTNEALNQSVKEAVAMGEAAAGIGAGVTAAAMFGVREQLDGGGKKNRKLSTVPSTDDFFWFNKLDVAERPSYKTPEMYYHYFDTAKDCIEDLLIEMYDCALVRTEEIRYIAYGIEPRSISVKDILSSGNYANLQKLKEPTTQDLVRIYEKWCGYVDQLFDKIELHADEYTFNEIRRMLCEYGRNDVDVLIEGK